ncbi:MAG: rod shape-determining protein MreC [Gammaproteobacteria bacterium]|nr:rod shape-determining protein MreC [Gammaproteobacteria bacterium]NIM73682.1 rod shape-determining protein MreC [Gammaproteobacteria bacterium]NIN37356.1 rod shape-determining protein MreC [Gammaproteobacteria bacterium]NIO25515.1 rod shape-determining protein MreC [Gammaproteobacteria bacterium]NIO66190.1 rod shape-determining protein MreC [Gammaproteobacteria bacterium]
MKPNKPLFDRGSASLARLLAVSVLSVVLMTVDHRAGHLEALRSVLSTLVYPLQVAVDLPIQAGNWLAEQLSSRHRLITENARLRQEQFLLATKLEKFADLEAENRRLRDLLDSSAKVGERVLVAELLSVDMDPYSRRIVLNKGSRDGVESGQSLIDSNGVLGQVVHVAPFSSNALLITDPSHALPVQNHRSGLRSVAVGTGPLNQLELAHLPNNADVRIGDLLVTSGLGGRFPAGYPVGRIVNIERNRGRPFATVMVQPSARLERNREVLLVWPAETDDPSDTMTTNTEGAE